MKFRIALIQMDSQEDKTANVEKALELCHKAIHEGAEWILLPEVFNQRSDTLPIRFRKEPIPGPSLTPFMKLGVWILAGSICEESKNRKAYNTSVLINPDGLITAQYRKIHLFDVRVGQTLFKESGMFLPGDTPTLARMPFGEVGLSICFDLRFPELYRHYSRRGAVALTVPSSFTRPTGEKHWEVLLRARAIENQCYVLAPNQTGMGPNQIPSYGNSMVVGPTGEILARASEKETVIVVDLDFTSLENLRKNFPIIPVLP